MRLSHLAHEPFAVDDEPRVSAFAYHAFFVACGDVEREFATFDGCKHCGRRHFRADSGRLYVRNAYLRTDGRLSRFESRSDREHRGVLHKCRHCRGGEYRQIARTDMFGSVVVRNHGMRRVCKSCFHNVKFMRQKYYFPASIRYICRRIMSKRLLILLLSSIAICAVSFGQRRDRGIWYQTATIENGDSIAVVHILPVRKYARKKDMRRYAKLIRAVKKVYPIAQEAKREMALMEEELRRLPSKKDRELYTKGIQKMIIKKYTPVLKRMTVYEGRVLLKLIDRETEYTAFEIVKEFRGGFVAGFWQAMARLFGNNLKLEYDPDGSDKMLEQIVVYYEAGLL